jgi:RimJ/RimL family protein N-acetyltransferase
MTELITERLILRAPQSTDLDALYALTESVEMRRYLGGDPPSRVDSFNRLLRNAGSWSLYGYGTFMCVDRESGALIGNCGIFHSHRGLGKDFDDHPEAGWIIAQNQWGKGYAREAMTKALDWFDKAHGPHKIVAMIEEGNEASVHLADRLGFTFTRHDTLRGAAMRLHHRG